MSRKCRQYWHRHSQRRFCGCWGGHLRCYHGTLCVAKFGCARLVAVALPERAHHIGRGSGRIRRDRRLAFERGHGYTVHPRLSDVGHLLFGPLFVVSQRLSGVTGSHAAHTSPTARLLEGIIIVCELSDRSEILAARWLRTRVAGEGWLHGRRVARKLRTRRRLRWRSISFRL